MSEHSPLPWKADEDAEIWSAESVRTSVARTDPQNRKTTVRAKADAAYIVRACNGYPKLLEACKGALDMLCDCSVPDSGLGVLIRRMEQAITEAEA